MSKEELAQKSCVPCKGDVPPLRGEALQKYSSQLPEWEVVDEHHLRREYDLKNFAEALALVNRIGEVAEAEGHHPNLSFTWGKVEVEIFTHAIDGLTESDFVLAAKVEQLER